MPSNNSSAIYFIFSPDGTKTTNKVLHTCQEICRRKDMAFKVIELPAYDPGSLQIDSSSLSSTSLDNVSLHARNKSYSRIWRQNVLESVTSSLDTNSSSDKEGNGIKKDTSEDIKEDQLHTVYFVIPQSTNPFPYPFYLNYLLSAMCDLQVPLLLALNKSDHTAENFTLLKSLWLQELQNRNIPTVAIASCTNTSPYSDKNRLNTSSSSTNSDTITDSDTISIDPVSSFDSTIFENIAFSPHFFTNENSYSSTVEQKNSPILSDATAHNEDLPHRDTLNTSSAVSKASFTTYAKPSYYTTLRFQHYLFETARSHQQTIVLPESNDERTLRAADRILRHKIARILFIGNPDTVISAGEKLGLSSFHTASYFQQTPPSIEPLIPQLTQLRAHKGLSEEEAQNLLLTDVNYLGVMLVYSKKADGMVSGACHSTADTVRPALQLIPLKPANHRVSGAMLMCVDGRIEVHADIALEIAPSNERLVEIARQTADTAKAFGIDPIIGLLSYSTLHSGKGIDVDKTWEVVHRLHNEYPELKVVGPIQFDAAWSPEVAAQKIPNDPYAGHVNVYIYPNLTASNIAIKSIEHIGEGIAVGPILQGLEKPITDLSRGADVDDIADTIAATSILAFQSQNEDISLH